MFNNNTAVRKHKVELTDYGFERDISIRLFLANLSELEKSIIEEIVNSSVKISMKQLASALSVSVEEIVPLLEELAKLDLFKMQGDQLLINKELRKYFAYEIEKFSPDFDLDMLHLQAILNKVPIHILPQWYAIPRATDNIFASILEKYFITPSAYRKHLEEMTVECPLLSKLYTMIAQSEDFSVSAEAIMKSFKLSHESFEKLMLEFEYNLFGCLCYKKEGDVWNEYATLYYEWKSYKAFKRERVPKRHNPEIVLKNAASDFYFVEELSKYLRSLEEGFPMDPCAPLFAEVKNMAEKLHIIDNPQAWLRKTKQEQASSLYRLLLSQVRNSPSTFSERDLREIEKALKAVSSSGWILFDDFLRGFTGSICCHRPIELQRKGKKWRYDLPQYSDEEKELIRAVIADFLWKPGIIALGTVDGAPCFMVTPFGRMSLGD